MLEYTDSVDLLLPATMQAAVVHKFGEPLVLETRPVPRPGSGQVLIKVAACGVCPTDLHAAQGDFPVKPQLPFIPGHEVAGTVRMIGNLVQGIKVGDRVGVAWLHQACGHCEFCLTGHETLCKAQQNTGYSVNGGYAEYIVADADYAVPLPLSLSFEQAAPILCAGVTSYKALKVADLRAGQWVAIYGVGELGQMAIEYALAMGYRVAAVDKANSRLDLARRLGAEEVINSSQADPYQALQTLLGGVQSTIITFPSVSTFEQGVRSLKRGGTWVLVGLTPDSFPLDIFNMELNELTIRGSIVGTRAGLLEALEFAAPDKVQPVYQTASLGQINQIFTYMEQGSIKGRYVLTM
jgi:propanol-preferring alcohol dehydrogenase